VLGYDPNVCAGTMKEYGIEKYDDLHEMLEQCDYVSSHAVLNEDTHHMIGQRELGSMKAEAFPY